MGTAGPDRDSPTVVDSAKEAFVPPGGGPPPHIHRNEDELALDPTQPPPDNVDEVAARYAAAAPRYGLEFL